jgi:hypothetical protein
MVGLLLLKRRTDCHPDPSSFKIRRDLAVVSQGRTDMVLAAPAQKKRIREAGPLQLQQRDVEFLEAISFNTFLMSGYLGVSDCLKTHSLRIHSAQSQMNKLRFLTLFNKGMGPSPTWFYVCSRLWGVISVFLNTANEVLQFT